MVCNRKRLARAAIQQFKAKFIFDVEPASAPKDAVQMNGPIRVGNAVFRKKNDLQFALRKKVNQLPNDGVNGLEVGSDDGIYEPLFGSKCSKPLQIVIEMRKINQAQGRMIFLLDPFGRFRNPSRCRV